MDFTFGTFAASACAITLGAVLQASTGLGAGLVIVPLLGLISLDLIPGPAIFASLASSFLMAFLGRTHINFFNMKTLMAGLMVGMALGTLSLSALPLDRAGILFGGLVLLAVAITAAGTRIPFTRPNLIAAGALSGFMGATAAIGAPVLALLYQHEEGNTLRATLAFLYFVSSIVMLAFLYAADHFGAQEVRLGLYLLPGYLAGYVLAAPVAKILDRGYSRAAVLVISTVSAVALVAKSLW
jgi:uncharacterized membrane protein YfcA